MKHTRSRFKNRNTKAAVACCELEEKYYCALNVHLMPKTISNFILGKILWMNYFLYSNFSANVH